jgi:hypothetical protein
VIEGTGAFNIAYGRWLCSLFLVACKQRSADVTIISLRNGIETALAASEHYIPSHATFTFPRDRFLRPVYGPHHVRTQHNRLATWLFCTLYTVILSDFCTLYVGYMKSKIFQKSQKKKPKVAIKAKIFNNTKKTKFAKKAKISQK